MRTAGEGVAVLNRVMKQAPLSSWPLARRDSGLTLGDTKGGGFWVKERQEHKWPIWARTRRPVWLKQSGQRGEWIVDEVREESRGGEPLTFTLTELRIHKKFWTKTDGDLTFHGNRTTLLCCSNRLNRGSRVELGKQEMVLPGRARVVARKWLKKKKVDSRYIWRLYPQDLLI